MVGLSCVKFSYGLNVLIKLKNYLNAFILMVKRSLGRVLLLCKCWLIRRIFLCEN